MRSRWTFAGHMLYGSDSEGTLLCKSKCWPILVQYDLANNSLSQYTIIYHTLHYEYNIYNYPGFKLLSLWLAVAPNPTHPRPVPLHVAWQSSKHLFLPWRSVLAWQTDLLRRFNLNLHPWSWPKFKHILPEMRKVNIHASRLRYDWI